MLPFIWIDTYECEWLMPAQRIVFANSFDSVRQLWIKDQSALVSRPTFHTFHSVVSSSQGFTIGTSP